MEDATNHDFQDCKDPLDTGTETRDPAKDHAGDQACGANRSRSELSETGGCEDTSPVSTRQVGRDTGCDLETYFRARRYACRKNRERIGHSAPLFREKLPNSIQRHHIPLPEDDLRYLDLALALFVKASDQLAAFFVSVGEGAHSAILLGKERHRSSENSFEIDRRADTVDEWRVRSELKALMAHQRNGMLPALFATFAEYLLGLGKVAHADTRTSALMRSADAMSMPTI